MTIKIKELYDSLQKIQEEKQQLKQKESELNELINESFKERFNVLREASGKKLGTISFNLEGMKVSQNIPKKIEWDQDVIEEIYSDIEKTGENPKDYIKVKYSVSERDFNSFNEEIKDRLKEARIIKDGSVQIKIEEIENDE